MHLCRAPLPVAEESNRAAIKASGLRGQVFKTHRRRRGVDLKWRGENRCLGAGRHGDSAGKGRQDAKADVVVARSATVRSATAAPARLVDRTSMRTVSFHHDSDSRRGDHTGGHRGGRGGHTATMTATRR
jgi:hypothetical protein